MDPDGPFNPIEQVDEFSVIERTYSADQSKLSVGLANISALVPDVDGNKDKVLRAARIFKERGVNVAVFPEFCLSGYFWEDEQECREYMDTALTERQADWIDAEMLPLVEGDLRGITRS